MYERFSILVVEDDEDILQLVGDLLRQNDYQTVQARTGPEALTAFDDGVGLVLLDLMLPGLTGEHVLEEIRKRSQVPIIALTAKSDKASTVALLKSGADDYIVKPFNNEELLARIEAQLRRHRQFAMPDNAHTIVFKDLQLTPDTYTACIGDVEINLTRREFAILKLLMRYPKKVFTKANIYEHVWSEDDFGDDSTVSVHVSNIRSKLAKENPDEEYIRTVWGIGFKMSDANL
ncbi:response regulator transcription factor [Paenibacillus lautus]|uniref:response regulator transcription factor n=1 Tax=Paenibacillus lautus TaxID=1401 RepID=UPI003D9A8200